MEDKEHNLGLDAKFIDDEEIVPKLQLIEDRESNSPYQHSADKNMRYFERCELAIQAVPTEHRRFAWALFANAIYLPDDLLSSTWPHLLNKAAQTLNVPKEELIECGLLLELDAANLHYDFIQKCRIPGRLDTDKFPRQVTTVGALLNMMVSLVSSEGGHDEEKETVRDCLKKSYWLLLVDNALSGTSLCSEIDKVSQVLPLFPDSYKHPYVVVMIQVFTEDAKEMFDRKLNQEGWEDNILYVPAIQLGPEFKINDDRCRLFNDEKTRQGVLEFCRWFAQDTGLATDQDLIATKNISGDNLRYGFKSVGLTLVTPNCPTDSVPPLWYPTIDKINIDSTQSQELNYVPPFPRLHSRPRQTRSKDKEHLAILQDNYNVLRFKIE